LLGRRRFDAERLAEQLPAAHRQRMVALDQVRPPSGKQGAEKAQRVRDAKKGSGIVGPGPVELQSEPRALRSRGVRPVADRQGTDALLAIAPHVQERGSLRRAEPLV